MFLLDLLIRILKSLAVIAVVGLLSVTLLRSAVDPGPVLKVLNCVILVSGLVKASHIILKE